MSTTIEPATATDFKKIADLNVRCYEEFASALAPFRDTFISVWRKLRVRLV